MRYVSRWVSEPAFSVGDLTEPQRNETMSVRPAFAGLRRYRCNSCAPTVNAAPQSSRLNHEKGRLFSGASLSEGQVINVSPTRCGVIVATVFYRRHRFIKALGMAPAKLKNIIETDENLFSEEPKETPFRQPSCQAVNAAQIDSGSTRRRTDTQYISHPSHQQSARSTEEFTVQLSRSLDRALQPLLTVMPPQNQNRRIRPMHNAPTCNRHMRSCKSGLLDRKSVV